jgi:hypothetical protein
LRIWTWSGKPGMLLTAFYGASILKEKKKREKKNTHFWMGALKLTSSSSSNCT